MKSHVTDIKYNDFYQKRRSEKVLQIIRSSFNTISSVSSVLGSPDELLKDESGVHMIDSDAKIVLNKNTNRSSTFNCNQFTSSFVQKLCFLQKNYEDTHLHETKIHPMVKYELLGSGSFIKSNCSFESFENNLIMFVEQLIAENNQLRIQLLKAKNTHKICSESLRKENDFNQNENLNHDNGNEYEQNKRIKREQNKCDLNRSLRVMRRKGFDLALCNYRLDIYQSICKTLTEEKVERDSKAFLFEKKTREQMASLKHENCLLLTSFEQNRLNTVHLEERLENLEQIYTIFVRETNDRISIIDRRVEVAYKNLHQILLMPKTEKSNK